MQTAITKFNLQLNIFISTLEQRHTTKVVDYSKLYLCEFFLFLYIFLFLYVSMYLMKQNLKREIEKKARLDIIFNLLGLYSIFHPLSFLFFI